MAEKKEFLEGKKPVTFVDLFAGAGGISEGFMQAYTDHNYYDFVLASDINENCELTHRVRYNEQLGLDTKFITEDIMSPTFLPDLLMALDGKQVDGCNGWPQLPVVQSVGTAQAFRQARRPFQSLPESDSCPASEILCDGEREGFADQGQRTFQGGDACFER